MTGTKGSQSPSASSPALSSDLLKAGTDEANMTLLPILAFNDVYRLRQKYSVPAHHAAAAAAAAEREAVVNGNGDVKTRPDSSTEKEATISVGQFGRKLLDIWNSWPVVRGAEGKILTSSGASTPSSLREAQLRSNGQGDGKQEQRDGLVLFAGDVFNPSVESSVTRGSHMVPIMNALKIDASCVGNHDFDFGYPHLMTLMGSCHFPWLLSNIVDVDSTPSSTGNYSPPGGVNRFVVTERCGIRIGIIGLVEKDWIATIPSWPHNFEHRDMVKTAISLSQELRDKNGPHRVDLIIALTHCRVPNDIDLANALGAVKDSDSQVKDQHGVDLLIGGHDHMYYIGRGADEWTGFAREDGHIPGAEQDTGVRLIKSGTDFRDLSEAILTVQDQPEGSIRRKLIIHMKGVHHEITPSSPTSDDLEKLTDSLLSTVTSTMSKPVCFSLTPLDVRSEFIRTTESAIADFTADILLHAYAELLGEATRRGEHQRNKGEDTPRPPHEDDGKADAVIICAGTLRGDSVYKAGKVTMGDIMEIMPFEDPVVCLEIDGKGIWDTLENGLSKWPAQEG